MQGGASALPTGRGTCHRHPPEELERSAPCDPEEPERSAPCDPPLPGPETESRSVQECLRVTRSSAGRERCLSLWAVPHSMHFRSVSLGRGAAQEASGHECCTVESPPASLADEARSILTSFLGLETSPSTRLTNSFNETRLVWGPPGEGISPQQSSLVIRTPNPQPSILRHASAVPTGGVGFRMEGPTSHIVMTPGTAPPSPLSLSR